MFLAPPERRGRGPWERPEPQIPGVRKEPMLEQLKGTVQDIHDAIGEALLTGALGGVVCDPVTPGMRAHQATGFQGEGGRARQSALPRSPEATCGGPPLGGCLWRLEVPASQLCSRQTGCSRSPSWLLKA